MYALGFCTRMARITRMSLLQKPATESAESFVFLFPVHFVNSVAKRSFYNGVTDGAVFLNAAAGQMVKSCPEQIMEKESSARLFWVDLIRVASVLLVIVIHAGDYAIGYWGKFPFRHDAVFSWWIAAVAWNSIARVGVPLLFMVSGYLLLQTSDDIPTFFRKRFAKVFFPLMVWSVFYIWWKGFYADASIVEAVSFTVKYFVTGPTYYTLWFLYTLLGLYLVTPVFRPLIRSASKNELWYVLSLWGLSLVILMASSLLHWEITLLYQPYIAEYLGYFLAGYLLGREDFPRKGVYISLLAIILLIFGMCAWDYWIVTAGDGEGKFVFHYLSPQVAVLSFASFILLKNFGQYLDLKLHGKITSAVSRFAELSFGIYLVHAVILYWLADGFFGFKLNAMRGTPFIGIPLTVGVTFLVSSAVVFALRQIPIVKKIVP